MRLAVIKIKRFTQPFMFDMDTFPRVLHMPKTGYGTLVSWTHFESSEEGDKLKDWGILYKDASVVMKCGLVMTNCVMSDGTRFGKNQKVLVCKKCESAKE